MGGRVGLRAPPLTPQPISLSLSRRLDGSTNRIQRMIDIEMFNKPKSELFIYILCTRAGGLGVNLQVGRLPRSCLEPA
jgi:hypothetical protein